MAGVRRSVWVGSVVVLMAVGFPLEALGPVLKTKERDRPARTRCSDPQVIHAAAGRMGTWNADLTCSGAPETDCGGPWYY